MTALLARADARGEEVESRLTRLVRAGAGLRRTARHRIAEPLWLGLLGSLLLAVGALGVGTLPRADPFSPPYGVYLVRSWLLGRVGLTALAIVGVALLLAAWFAVGRAVRSDAPPGAGRLRTMVLVWGAPLVLVPPLFSRDLFSYAAQAHLLHAGHDPYEVGPWVEPGRFADSVDPMWAATPSPYGPVFLWLGHQVSALTGDSVYLTVLGMRVLALLGVGLLVVYLPRLAERCGADGRTALWLGLLNPLTFMHFIGGGHNDALMIGLVVAGLCLAMEGHPVFGAASIALAAGVKAPAAFALAFVGHIWASQLVGRHRLVRGLAGSGAAAFGTFAVLTAGTGLGYGWVQALGTPATVRTWLSPPTALGMLAGLGGRALDVGDHTYDMVAQSRFLFGALALIVLSLISLRLRRGWSPVRATAVALLVIVALGPVVQPWYLMWALVVIAAAGIRPGELAPLTWAVVGTVVVSQLNGSIMRGGLAVPGSLLVLALTAVVLSRSRAAEREAGARRGWAVDVPHGHLHGNAHGHAHGHGAPGAAALTGGALSGLVRALP